MEEAISQETLCMYRQRDVIASHVLRLGVHLFGEKDRICRRRLIDCKSISLLKTKNAKYNMTSAKNSDLLMFPKTVGASTAMTGMCLSIFFNRLWIECWYRCS